MSRAERTKYYADYAKTYPEKQSNVTSSGSSLTPGTVADQKEVHTSVPFSIRNNSLLPQKIEINGNVLKFNPMEVRYVGFAAGTKAYWYDKNAGDGRSEFLFVIGEKDRGKQLRLFN